MIVDLIKISIKSLLRNKIRTFLTIFGIYIGVVSIVLIITISDSAKIKISTKLENIEELIITARIFDLEGEYSRIPDNIIQELEQESSIKRIGTKEEMDWRDYNEFFEDNDFNGSAAVVQAVDIDYFNIYSKIKESIICGRIFSKIEEENMLPVCMLREDVAKELFKTTNCLGATVMLNNQRLKVVGIVSNDKKEYVSDNISEMYVLDSYVTNSNIEYSFAEKCYIIEPINNKSREEAYNKTEEKFSEYLSEDTYYLEQYVYSAEDVALEVIDIISTILFIIAGISIVSGGIGIMNVLLVSVNEKVKEIGLRRALGTNKKNIFLQFILEGIVIMIIAGILGIVTNIIIIEIANNVFSDYELDLYMKPKTVFDTMLFCGLIGILFGIYPAFKASRLNPVDALRS